MSRHEPAPRYLSLLLAFVAYSGISLPSGLAQDSFGKPGARMTAEQVEFERAFRQLREKQAIENIMRGTPKAQAADRAALGDEAYKSLLEQKLQEIAERQAKHVADKAAYDRAYVQLLEQRLKEITEQALREATDKTAFAEAYKEIQDRAAQQSAELKAKQATDKAAFESALQELQEKQAQQRSRSPARDAYSDMKQKGLCLIKRLLDL